MSPTWEELIYGHHHIFEEVQVVKFDASSITSTTYMYIMRCKICGRMKKYKMTV